MGGAPRIIRKIIKKDPPPPPASPIVERRTEVAKKTEAEGKTVTRRLKRRTRRRTQLVAPPNTSLTTDADYSPKRYILHQNFPNPFSSFTRLRYSLPKTMNVRLAIYDVLGREVAVVTKGTQDAGIYTETVDGRQLVPGIYYARIELDHLSFTKKLVRIP